MKMTVKRKEIDGKTVVYTRLTEEDARKLFNNGTTISVMTDTHTPADEDVIAIDYTRGEELFWNAKNNIACDFEQVKKDFAEWLGGDGYNHMPDHEAAENHNFSYWTCNIER